MNRQHADFIAAPQRYQPSGRIDIIRSVPWLVLLGVGIVLCATLLTIAFNMGLYIVIAMPVLASMLLALPILWLIGHGHWRNRWLAVVVAVLAAEAVYVGQYQTDLVWKTGLASVTRLDLLPEYLMFRMDTDVSRPSYIPESKVDKAPSTSNSVKNWVTFAAESFLVVMFPVAFAWTRAQRPFCESCKKWMRQAKAGYPLELASTMMSLIDAAKWNEIIELPQISLQQGKSATLLVAAYCDASRPSADASCPIYLSLLPTNAVGSMRPSSHEDTHRAPVPDRRLSPADAAGLVPVFPELKDGADAESVRQVESSLIEKKERDQASRRSLLNGERILIEELSDDSSPRVRGALQTIKAIFLATMPLIWLLGGIGLFILGFILAWPIIDPATTFVVWEACPDFIAYGTLIVGVLSAGFGWYQATRRMTSSYDRYVYKRLCEMIERRPDRIVSPGEAGAHFIQSMPLELWQQFQMGSRPDFGLLRFDIERGLILFEGDHRRMTIPARALADWSADTIANADGTASEYLILLRADDGSIELEMWFRPYADDWSTSASAKQAAAIAMLAKVADAVAASAKGSDSAVR